MGGASLINGNSQAELAEVKRITPKVAALVDSEKPSKEAPLGDDRIGFQRVCADLGFGCHVLARRAFENYFTDRAIKQAEGERYREPRQFEKMKDANPGWSKSWNWRVARELTRDELDSTDLGAFLRDL